MNPQAIMEGLRPEGSLISSEGSPQKLNQSRQSPLRSSRSLLADEEQNQVDVSAKPISPVRQSSHSSRYLLSGEEEPQAHVSAAPALPLPASAFQGTEQKGSLKSSRNLLDGQEESADLSRDGGGAAEQFGHVQIDIPEVDAAALQRLLDAAAAHDIDGSWQVWTEQGWGRVKIYDFPNRQAAQEFYSRKRVAKVLFNPKGVEVWANNGCNPFALTTIRNRQRISRAQSGSETPRRSTYRAVKGLAALDAYEVSDEEHHLDIMETVAAKMDAAFSPPSVLSGSIIWGELSAKSGFQRSGAGALEHLLANVEPSRIDIDRLINVLADILQTESSSMSIVPCSPMGPSDDAHPLRYPSYATTMISPDTLVELIKRATQVFNQECPYALHRITVPAEGRLIVVGDTHGQIQDVLWMFFKYGRPTAQNVYLFNGDYVDRGRYSVEILVLLMATKLHDERCIYLNRGNHEDVSMTAYYGFADELGEKFGPQVGAALHNQFLQLFQHLPICTVVQGIGPSVGKTAAVIHGGVPTIFGRPQAVTLDQIGSIDHRRSIPVMQRKSDADEYFFCTLWSDPRDAWLDPDDPDADIEDSWWPEGPMKRRGGGRGLAFGAAASAAFLEKNKVDVLIRSHEVPKKLRGFQMHHDRRVCTVFSASNYCGESMNNGGVIIWDASSFPGLHDNTELLPGDGHLTTLAEHWAIPFAELPVIMRKHESAPPEVRAFVAERAELKSRSAKANYLTTTPEAIERKIVAYIKKMIVVRKAELWQEFGAIDTAGDYWVTADQWSAVCSKVLGDLFLWSSLQRFLVSRRESSENFQKIHYSKFLSRFTVAFDNKHGMYVGWQRQVLVAIFSHFLKQDLPLQAAMAKFDRDNNGFVSCAEFQQALHEVGAAITDAQAQALLRTLASVADTRNGVAIADFLSLFCTTFSHNRRWTSKENDLAWVSGCLDWIGAHVRRKSGVATLVDVFKAADQNENGYLEVEEFKDAFKDIICGSELEAEIRRVAEATSLAAISEDEVSNENEAAMLLNRLDQLARYLDTSRSGHISLLAFMSAFASRGTEEMRLDLLEQICVTIHKHKKALLVALHHMDPSGSGVVSRDRLKEALLELNCALETEQGRPLTEMQISELVVSLDDPESSQSRSEAGICYREFLDSFEYIDVEELEAKPELLQITSASSILSRAATTASSL